MTPTDDQYKAMIATADAQPEPARGLMIGMLSWLTSTQKTLDEIKGMLLSRPAQRE